MEEAYLFARPQAEIELRRNDRAELEELGLSALRVIGKGTFALVFHARDAAGQSRAVKKVYCPRELLPQKNFLQGLPDHPHVIRLLGCEERPATVGGGRLLYEVYEKYDINLDEVVRSLRAHKQAFPPRLFRRVSLCLLQALAHLHAHGVIHRDVKPANVLLRFPGPREEGAPLRYEDRRAEEVEVVLADLGLAVAVDRPRSTTYVCTRYYRAPELLFGYLRYTESIDVWALGCLLAELLRLRPLFRGERPTAVLARILATLGPIPPAALERYTGLAEPVAQVAPCGLAQKLPGADAQLLELLGRMLSLDDERRPSARVCLDLFGGAR